MGYEGALSSEEGREMVTIESCLQVTHSQEEKTLSLGDREVISREPESRKWHSGSRRNKQKRQTGQRAREGGRCGTGIRKQIGGYDRRRGPARL